MGFLGSIFHKKKKLTLAEIQFVRKEEKNLGNSLRTIQETDKIDVFFSRYDLAEKSLRLIAEIVGEDTKCIANGVSPAECIASLYNEKEAQTNAFLSRYVRKETVHILGLSRGQIQKANGIAAIIEEYADQMPPDSLDYGRKLAADMVCKVSKAVEK